MSGTMALPQPGSAVMPEAPVPIKDRVDAYDLGYHQGSIWMFEGHIVPGSMLI